MDVIMPAVDYDNVIEDLTLLRRHDHTHESDLLVAQWWAWLRHNGDLNKTFHQDLRPLAAFMGYFRSVGLLHFVTNKNGICFAAWFEPAFDGAYYGQWISMAYRHSMLAWRWTDTAIRGGLARWPVLVSVTIQEEVAEIMHRLGYNVLGRIPGLWGSTPVQVGYLNHDGYAGSCVRKLTERRDARVGRG